jgi:tetratricopeptide (TPR) repeat protein
MRVRTMILAVLLVSGLGSIAAAQDWRGGRARVDGTVKNEKREPIQGCKVMMRWGKSTHGGPDLTTDAKGQFAIFGLAGGPWGVDFEAAGYATKRISVSLQEGARNPSLDIQLDPQPKAQAPAAPAGQPQILVSGKKISKETAEAIEEGNAAMTAKNWAAARQTYLKASAELPDNAALLHRIAAAYLGEGNSKEALAYARQAADKDPSDPAAWWMIAELELQQGNLDAGRAALEKVPADKITDPQPYMNIGILLINKTKPAEAESAFDKAIAIKPDAWDGYYYRGLCRLQLKKNAEAKADLHKARELNPDGPEVKEIDDLLKTLS